jgi:hypothetical protein
MEFYRQAQRKQTPARKGKALELAEFAEKKFLPFIRASSLDNDTKRYYETGWRLLAGSPAKHWRMDLIKTSEAELLCFWQVGLAHFGGLIWPTLGTLRFRGQCSVLLERSP